MMLNIFYISIILLLCTKCFVIKNNQQLLHKYKISRNNNRNISIDNNRNYSKLSIFKVKKKNGKCNTIRIYLSKSEDESDNSKDVNKKNVYNLNKKKYSILIKTLENIKHGFFSIKTRLLKISFVMQLFISITFFFLHFNLLSKHFLILFPYQLVPNHSNILMSLDLNSTILFLSSLFYLKDFKTNMQLFKNKLSLNKFTFELEKKRYKNILSISVLLIASYILSGYVSIYTEKFLTILKSSNLFISSNIIKSLQILTGHFVWVACSIVIFNKMLYPYFKNNKSNLNLRYKDKWAFKVIYGYVFSHFIFNIVDIINNYIINYFTSEDYYLDNSIDDIVSEKELIPTILCIISPCFSAPFFEEYIYRFFVLKSLNLFMNIHYAITFSSLFFAVHHLNIFNLIPLFFLSFFWSYIYIYTDNILITMLIHSFWNIYVFLTSLST
ncbi:protease, putative [Hepatocystis sp. ex Piliocolobus tephrosceles]|nr:protease, putative [Hepatocystis sp. ex Piliocolobus tephrosceles]